MVNCGKIGPVLLLIGLIVGGSSPRPGSDQVGVYYFPGWLKSDWAPKGVWEPIKPYPDRKPLLGWYDQGSVRVMARQLKWMREYGIDYIVMDWYYSVGSVRLDEGLKAFLTVPQSRVKLSLLWANHDEQTTPVTWRAIVKIWLDKYVFQPSYLRKNGRPVIFIFSYERFSSDARNSGSDAKSYVDVAQKMAKAAGLPGLYLVADVDDLSPGQIAAGPAAAGFSAVSGYQFHRKPQIDSLVDPQWGRPSHGWAGLDAAYRAQWKAGQQLSIPMIVPMISGLDRRPWGGFTADDEHDRSISTESQFRTHLKAARRVMTQPGYLRSGLGVVCCWNEFGEGAFIEPTLGQRFGRLAAIKSVFGS